MNTDRYKIVISISHHRISYEYYLVGVGDELKSMPGGLWPAPLAFYCSPTGIIIGEEALRAAQANTPNAFTNYFEQLPLQKFYTVGGEKKNLNNILLDASESLFRNFCSNILFNQYGNLNDNRLHMPLVIVCEADIADNERAYLLNTFKDSGYDKVKVTDYNNYISQYILDTMSKEYTYSKFLTVWTEGVDLSLTFFNTSNNGEYSKRVYPGLGVDPRLPFVMETIWKDILGQDPWLNHEDEDETIRKVAMDFLNSTKPMVNDRLQVSNGNKYSYSINRNMVDFLDCKESIALKQALKDFLNENDITDRSEVALILRDSAADNRYFEHNLASGFGKVIRSDKLLRSRVMKLIVNSFQTSSLTVPTLEDKLQKEIPTSTEKRAWRNLKIEVVSLLDKFLNKEAESVITSFINQMHTMHIDYFDNEAKELLKRAQINTIGKNVNTEQVLSKPESKDKSINSVKPSASDKIGMRETIVKINSALKDGNTDLALKIGRDFLDRMHNKGIFVYDDKIEERLASIKSIVKNKEKEITNLSKIPNENAPSKKDERDFRILESSVLSKLSIGESKIAKAEINTFMNQMHKRGIYAFDTKLKELQQKIQMNKSNKN